MPLFWVGTGIGFLMSSITVLIASELMYRSRMRHMPHLLEADYSIEENLGSAMQYGAQVIAEAAQKLTNTFNDARSEMIRFGLGKDGGNSDESGWYMDEEAAPRRKQKPVADLDYEAD
jgi:hypothetical protein